MKKYEYKIESFDIPSPEGWDSIYSQFLNVHSSSGWKVINEHYTSFGKIRVTLEKEIFKRKKLLNG